VTVVAFSTLTAAASGVEGDEFDSGKMLFNVEKTLQDILNREQMDSFENHSIEFKEKTHKTVFIYPRVSMVKFFGKAHRATKHQIIFSIPL
jgi:hypothetical protein